MLNCRPAVGAVLLGLTPAVLSGCKGDLSTLNGAGPAAEMIAGLWWAMLAGAGALTVMMLGLVAWGFRAPGPRAPSERFWALIMGVVFSLSVLAVTVGAGVWVGERLQAVPDRAVPVVEARATQWAWDFTQTHPEQGPVTRRNLLFIPAGRPVDVHITSGDVVHSFWVPRLAGKLDAIPGHVNILRLQADRPGRYSGQSAEFSGPGYGRMRFEVIAYDEAAVPDFLSDPPTTAPEAR